MDGASVTNSIFSLDKSECLAADEEAKTSRGLVVTEFILELSPKNF